MNDRAAFTDFSELTLTILMPCLDEARTLASCIARAQGFLARSGIDGEVLIADNGSSDGSQLIASFAGARVIQVARRGYGSALQAGIEASRGRLVLMGDCDSSYDFERLDGFIAALGEGADMVIGDRFAGGIEPGAMRPLHRFVGNPVLSFLGRLFFKNQIRDFHCGLRAFKREAILQLRLTSSGMEYASEMIVKAVLNGLVVAEVPTTLSPDGRDRPPHLRSWADGWRHLRFLLLHAPQWLFLYPGAAVASFCGLLMVILELGPVQLGPVGLDIHSLLYAMVGLNVGVQMAMFAVTSHVHACRIGMLRSLPAKLRWIDNVSLEQMLTVSGSLLVAGFLLAVASASYWVSVDQHVADPRVLMRIAIPAGVLLMTACQLGVNAFLLEYIRMSARVELDAPNSVVAAHSMPTERPQTMTEKVACSHHHRNE